ncbi:hypothetical protein PLESTB_000948000 [Pleodorina starrii]|uniref:Sphingomyelin phosphodiesterase 4 n=1 Tax=Pleodorina starrii TaxID=330485 RepID=A0A9W6F3F9_9CHLO|nr:hypothetical protein PLESTM_001151000 [Pleodorina starrii]GLC55138.1 hypothetical protein PLESTB_000948000 [Pleodorina starrii]GLC71109.1 hypothetical protein PLESTF_001075500 [Pleodorina starrii]
MAVSSPYVRDPFVALYRLLDAQHNTPGSIRKTCLAVEECLANNRDNLRGFFDKPFSNLLKRVFGYGDFEASWLNIVTKGRDADARALVDLLAPDGKLFAAMAQADSDHLVQYIFPTERLPAHTQELLKEPNGLGRRLLDTWPQYRGRLRHDPAGRPQVYLNLFEYFMFWTAFYVLRGSAADNGRSDHLRTQPGSSTSSMIYGMSGFRSVGSAIVGNLITGRPAGVLQSHPYYCLLKTYLEYFLPRSGSGAGGGGANGAAASRASPAAAAAVAAGAVGGGIGGLGYGLGLADGAGGAGAAGWASYKPTLTAAAAGPDSRGALLLSILVEFWLTDLAEPLPSALTDRVSGVVLPGGFGGPLSGLAAGGGLGAIGSPVGAVGIAGSASPAPLAVATPPSVRLLTYQPPSEELVEGLVALVRYVHVIEQDARQPGPGQSLGGRSPAGASAAQTPAAPGSAGAGARSAPGSAGRHGSGGGGGPPRLVLLPAQAGRPPWLPEVPVKTPPPPQQRLLVPPTALQVHGSSASAAVQAVSRKVYRQLRRALSQWPAGSPNSLTPLISLWLSVLAPWCPLYAHTRKAVAMDTAAATNGHIGVASAQGGHVLGGSGAAVAGGGGGGGLRHSHHDGVGALSSAAAAAAGMVEATAAKLHLGGGSGGRDRDRDLAGATSRELLSQYKYTPAWRGHVLAHLPFYLVLLPQFASLSLSRLKYRPDVALRDLDRVLAVLAAAGPELLRELRVAEAAYNDFLRPASAGGRRRSEGEYGEMVPWWLEQAQDWEAAAAAGSPPQNPMQLELAGRLFTTDPAGAAYTTCLLLRNAEMLGRPELVAALRQSACAVLPLESILPAAATEAEQGGAGEGAAGTLVGADVRRFPKAGRWSSHWSTLVQQEPRLTDPRRLWAHMYRGRGHDPLYRPIASNEVACLVRPLVLASNCINAALGLDAPYRPGEEQDDPPEHLGQQALLWARKRGYRVNLRIFAEVQTLAWILVLTLLLYTASRVFGSGGLFGGGDGGVSEAAGGAVPGGGNVRGDGAMRGFVPAGGGYSGGGAHDSLYGRGSYETYYQHETDLTGHNVYVSSGGGSGASVHKAHVAYQHTYGLQDREADLAGRTDPGLEDAPEVVDGGYRFRS